MSAGHGMRLPPFFGWSILWPLVHCREKEVRNELILRRFNMVIDYERKRLILEKNGAFDEPFEQDMLGALFVIDGDDGDGGNRTGRIVVHSVL